jgi:hypothetical protein
MPNINDYIGPDGCDLDYKGSDNEPREDDESFVNTRFTNYATLQDFLRDHHTKKKIDKAVRGFWKGVDNAESE